MNEIERAVTTDILTAAPRVWIIATGEYDERTPWAVVYGTEADAERYAERHNAYVWCDAEFITPHVQD